MLQPGQRVIHQGEIFIVAHVNASRAHLVPERKRQCTVTDRRTGKARTFEATRPGIDVSPNACLEPAEARR
jgi:hypothetical protein